MSFLIPLKERGISASSNDNVLWNEGKVFVMDNHRLALWCWFQKMQKGKRYNLFHVDAHPDMSESALKYFKSDLWSMSLEDYRTSWQEDINEPLFRWDNYIEILLKKYPEQVAKTISATHHLGSSKELSEEVKAYDLLKNFHGIFSGERFVNDFPWILNLDLDYFFSAAPEKVLLFSEDYIKALARAIEQGLQSGIIEIFTISLSPECCGSWENSEMLLKYFSKCKI